MKVCRVTEIRELDRRAIKEYGIPAAILMENAGNAVYQVIRQQASVKGKRFLVLCGPGNNGGDGCVGARLLQANGADAKVSIFADKDQYRHEARQNREILSRYPVALDFSPSLPKLKRSIKSADFIVDALLGTGVDRPVAGILHKVIAAVNASGKTVFAVDIPSGINGDTGQEMGISIKAAHTITFGLPKVGNLLYPGYGCGGKLHVSHISFPTALTDAADLQIEVPTPAALPPRRANANKFDYGPALVIAGAANYYWAPFASAYSFLKAGGGYVYLACPQSLAKTIARRGKEIVFQPQAETARGGIAYRNKKALLELAQRMRFVIIGPGLSLDEETQQLVKEIVAKIEQPVLIDGDGITAIAPHPEILQKRRAPTVLTPHAGEMSRLTGQTKTQIEADRIGILQATARRLNACIVLKGAHSLIGYPDGRVNINLSGTTGGEAGMATAGAGDVLTGTIAAMYCLGRGLEKAVSAGGFIHGLAGDIAAEAKGADGMVAQDILDSLPPSVKSYRENYAEFALNYHRRINVI